MAARTRERPPAWAAVLLGWIVGAGRLESRDAAWPAPAAPPVCTLDPPRSRDEGGAGSGARCSPWFPWSPGPRELRSIPGVGQVRAVTVARYLLERRGRRDAAGRLPGLADLTGIPGVGPVIGGRLVDHFARRETPGPAP